MVKNMSKTDGIIRIIIALVIVGLWASGLVGGVLLITLGVVAFAFIITGFINFCPIYAILKIRTRQRTGN